MKHPLIQEKDFNYIEVGEGTPIIVLHGLMGGLSNFDSVTEFFSQHGYKILIPELPIYSMSLLKTNVKHFAIYLKKFIEHKGFDEVILLGNSLGGHIGLYHTKMFPEKVKALVITGSYRNARSNKFGGSSKAIC